ncbi:MAG: MFS transporter [Planctomycetota bacterium]
MPSPDPIRPAPAASRRGGFIGTPIRGLAEWIGGFHPRSVPAPSRKNFRRELTAGVFLPFALTAVEGAVIAVIVRIGFEGRVAEAPLEYAAGLLAVIPALANITSFLWVRLSHGADKVRFITMLQTLVLIDVALIALLPRTAVGLWLLVAQVLLARVCWAGIITLRSTVWRQNYPTGTRARLTGRFAAVQVLMIALLGWALGKAQDFSPDAFRIMYPIAAVLGLMGVLQWRRVRVRGHKALRKHELETPPKEGPSLNPLAMIGTLRRDRRFAVFMLCQFLLGMGNIMAMAVIALVLRDRFELNNEVSLLITSSVPLALMPMVIPLWAKALDGTHIVHFRAVHSWVFVAALGCFAAAAFIGLGPSDDAATSVGAWAMALLFLGAVFRGIAFGGGVLAWTLGHLDFAPPERASQYMGVHVTLTGVRGLLSWLFGVSMYRVLEDAMPGKGGAWMFVICGLIAAVGAIGFCWMSVWFKRHGVPAKHTSEPEPAPPSRVGV